MQICHAFPASAAETIRLTGDFDGDLKVTATDAQKTLEFYAESIVSNVDNTVIEENSNVDIDMNGEIDVLDAQSILLYYCRTLVGDQPLWAEFRDVSYHDGSDWMVLSPNEEDRFARVPNEEPFDLKGLYVEIGCAQGAPGETVTVPVYFAGGDLSDVVMFVDTPEGLELTDITSPVKEDFNLWCPETVEQYYAEWDGEEHIAGSSVLYCPSVGSWGFEAPRDLDMKDGYTVAYYSYKIPEDAQSGTVYPICLDASKCEFCAKNPNKEKDPDEEVHHFVLRYEFTLLNGVVIVE